MLFRKVVIEFGEYEPRILLFRKVFVEFHSQNIVLIPARIYGFNVRDASLHREGPNVSVTLDNVIYDLFDNMVNDIKETLPLIESTNEIGENSKIPFVPAYFAMATMTW